MKTHGTGFPAAPEGPEGGDGGGEIVAQGTPEDVVRVARSYTGQFLKPVLGKRENKRKKCVQAAE